MDFVHALFFVHSLQAHTLHCLGTHTDTRALVFFSIMALCIFLCVNKCSCGLSSQSLYLCVCLYTKAFIERHAAWYNPVWMIGSVSIATGQRKAERRALWVRLSPGGCECMSSH